MTYRVEFVARAKRAFVRLPGPDRDLIGNALDDLERDPTIQNPNVAALQGPLRGFLRYRKGDFRIVYSVDHSEQTVTVAKIANRRDVYR